MDSCPDTDIDPINAYKHIYIYVCMYVCMYVCINIYVLIYICICICICITYFPFNVISIYPKTKFRTLLRYF